jgi:hypothetical protein
MPKPRGAAANTVLQPRQPNTMLHLCTSPVTGPPLLLLYLLHTYYTMIVAELGFRMLERDTFHTKLVRY